MNNFNQLNDMLITVANALDTAQLHKLTDAISIRLITPPYFIATKLEAYNGRGKFSNCWSIRISIMRSNLLP